MAAITVSALWIYPVKSLAGVALHAATLTHAGLRGDREWMIVDAQDAFITQRKLPRLATIKTHLAESDALRLTSADGDSVDVPQPEGAPVKVRVWRDDCLGLAADKEINQWLTHAAASTTPLTLVHFLKQQPRALDAERFGPFTTHFADAAPYLVANNASLQALNAHLASQALPPVDMRRFRPNIVIDGLSAFHEHQYTHLQSRSGNIAIILKDHCQRCSIITVDQTTGEPSSGALPFKQLAQINSMPGNAKAPAFGVNAVLLSGEGMAIRCGDRLTLGRLPACEANG